MKTEDYGTAVAEVEVTSAVRTGPHADRPLDDEHIPADAFGRTRLEHDYLDALRRIEMGVPRDPDLAAKAARGAIRPSQANVAQEAGRSRTPITGKNPDLPRVQAEITAAQRRWSDARRPPDALSSIRDRNSREQLARENASLREQNTELRRRCNAAYTSAVAVDRLAIALAKAGRRADRDLQAARRAAETLSLDA